MKGGPGTELGKLAGLVLWRGRLPTGSSSLALYKGGQALVLPVQWVQLGEGPRCTQGQRTGTPFRRCPRTRAVDYGMLQQEPGKRVGSQPGPSSHAAPLAGFLTDDLVRQEDSGNQKKYLGVCRLPGPGRRHRRLDIIVVPHCEFACALLYFTGSAHFNRSMRALAKTKGMSLSEHALHTAVVRAPGGRKMGPGLVLPTPTERDVFTLLGLPYREPAERDW